MSFLFHDRILTHASDTAVKAFNIPEGVFDWLDLKEKLTSRFPNLPDDPDFISIGGQSPNETTRLSMDQLEPAIMRISRKGRATRIVLENSPNGGTDLDPVQVAQNAELALLRRAVNGIPCPMWQVNDNGAISWENAAYTSLAEATQTEEETDTLFHLPDEGMLNEGKSCRTRVETRDGASSWFQMSHISSTPHARIYHASNIDPVVHAEAAQRNFVQTLTKTFAQLSIGLAIFDRNTQLALFNPALVDLSGLSVEFLSRRPTTLTFFDQLRENRRMPEPKNYKSWRHEMNDIITAASDGRYHEVWSLDSGQTYSIKGRPHPDGAIAFLIEDISAEVTQTRNFRAELEIGQSLIDSLDDALAVFSATGTLTYSNKAYQDLWGFAPDQVFADVSINDAISLWSNVTSNSIPIKEIESHVLHFIKTDRWHFSLTLNSGEVLICQMSTIASGATLVRFAQEIKMPVKDLLPQG